MKITVLQRDLSKAYVKFEKILWREWNYFCPKKLQEWQSFTSTCVKSCKGVLFGVHGIIPLLMLPTKSGVPVLITIPVLCNHQYQYQNFSIPHPVGSIHSNLFLIVLYSSSHGTVPTEINHAGHSTRLRISPCPHNWNVKINMLT